MSNSPATPPTTPDNLDRWSFMHGTAAGCASIGLFEAVRALPFGGITWLLYAVISIGLVHTVHLHRKHTVLKTQVRDFLPTE
jgi:hypothetical protein